MSFYSYFFHASMLTGVFSFELPRQCYNPAEEHNGDVLSRIFVYDGEGKRSNITGSDETRVGTSCSQTSISFGFTNTEDTRVDDSVSRTGANGGSKARSEGSASSTANYLRDRVGCFTWNWFTMTMATGGIANVLFSSTGTQLWNDDSVLMLSQLHMIPNG